jgi:hypothetical protein
MFAYWVCPMSFVDAGFDGVVAVRDAVVVHCSARHGYCVLWDYLVGEI